MKRRDLLVHLTANGCRFVREGGDHSIWVNPQTGQRVPIPRHREILEFTAKRICQQLGVPER